jgi:hypothetical protein
VVVAVGDTLTLPVEPNVPGTPEIVTLVAFGIFQVSVELLPWLIVDGEAVKDDPATVGHEATVTVACS